MDSRERGTTYFRDIGETYSPIDQTRVISNPFNQHTSESKKKKKPGPKPGKKQILMDSEIKHPFIQEMMEHPYKEYQENRSRERHEEYNRKYSDESFLKRFIGNYPLNPFARNYDQLKAMQYDNTRMQQRSSPNDQKENTWNNQSMQSTANSTLIGKRSNERQQISTKQEIIVIDDDSDTITECQSITEPDSPTELEIINID